MSAEELASSAGEGKLGRATGRVLLGNNHYTTLSVTCQIRATLAASGNELEQLGEEYLAATSSYGLRLGRSLFDGGTPPARIEVDAECQLERSGGGEPRLADLSLDVRGEVDGSDQATFEAAAADSGLVQAVWGVLPNVRVVARLDSASTARPHPLAEGGAEGRATRPTQRNVSRRRRTGRRLILLVVLCVAGLAYVFVRSPERLNIFAEVVTGLGLRPDGAGLATAMPVDSTATPVDAVNVAGSQTSESLTGSATPVATREPTAAPAPLAAVAITPTPQPTLTPIQVPPTFTAIPARPSPTLASSPGAAARFEETFANNARQWPNNPQSTAWLGSDGLNLAPRQAMQFVAVRAPTIERFRDVRVTGVFRKLGGPAGGGYGLIVRDQSQAPLDGISQIGSYYVFEAGDEGKVGIWRRNGDRWVEILPWTPSAAVHPEGGSNELVAQVRGSQLEFAVNGIQVASQEEAALADGGVGVFVGGDGNAVVLSRFVAEPLD